MLRHPAVASRIEELQRAATEASRSVWDVAKIQQLYMAVLDVDPNEISGVRLGCCRRCWGDDHGHQWREREYLDALEMASTTGSQLPDIGGGFGFVFYADPHPECPECGGEGVPRAVFMDTRYLSPGAKFLFRGVKQTRHGLELIFADKDKAIENLGKMLGAFTERVSLTGQLQIGAALAIMEGDDPHAAAEAYQQMLRAGGHQ